MSKTLLGALFLLSLSILPAQQAPDPQAPPAPAQAPPPDQEYAGKFDVYTGFAYLETSAINLAQRGFHMQLGYNRRRWYAVGFDYSTFNGTLNITPRDLSFALQNELAPLLGFLPPTYHPSAPTDINTQTFALGPTLVIRKIRHVGILLHPSIGALRVYATPHAFDPVSQAAVSVFFTGTHLLDWEPFYGVGGALDFRIKDHVGVRMQTDVIWDDVINNILGRGHWTVRLSIGPSFKLGKNVER